MVIFQTGNLSLGQSIGTVSVLNALSIAGNLTASGNAFVTGDLYIGGLKLENENGSLYWNGSSVGGGSG